MSDPESSNPECERFINGLLDGAAETPELIRHLSVCPACSRKQKVLHVLHRRTPGAPLTRFPALAQKIVQSAEAAHSGPGCITGKTVLLTWGWLFLPLALVLGVFLATTRQGDREMRMTQEIPRFEFDGTVQKAVLGEILKVPESGGTLRLHNGILLLFSGQSGCVVSATGVEIKAGQVRITVPPQNQGVTVGTPHGTLEILEAVFTLRISASETRVALESGRVKISSPGGPSQLLSTPGEITLGFAPQENGRTLETQNPGEEIR
jgi:hypothetical protein